jgi:hypothetical protein
LDREFQVQSTRKDQYRFQKNIANLRHKAEKFFSALQGMEREAL